MSQYDFQRYLDNKYDTVQLTQIHHYETIEQIDLDNNIILEGGLVVDANFTFNYTQDGFVENISGSQLVESVSNYEYEVSKNDKKREIVLLRKEYVGVIKEDMREIIEAIEMIEDLKVQLVVMIEIEEAPGIQLGDMREIIKAIEVLIEDYLDMKESLLEVLLVDIR